ncbi:unnamed protein product [Periconia digitata]|uniref:Uncharacterized protein n=1 Tax=Periconia digitata TaxID=1303443 RepID=A0A9W4UQQ2_9PLEO|nr:unnamed protein product [Periconia digitata]
MTSRIISKKRKRHSPSPAAPSRKNPIATTVKGLHKAKDDFTGAPVADDTLWYLTVNTPSEDTWTYHGPTKTFAALVPVIESTIRASTSVTAMPKWQKLLADDAEEQENQATEREIHGDAFVDSRLAQGKLRAKLLDVGITTFVIPRVLFQAEEGGVQTILQIEREVNPAVYRMLPAPVYTVSCEGPVPNEHMLMTEAEKGRQLEFMRASGKAPTLPAPRSTTSRIVGSFASTAAARSAATETMEELLEGTEEWKITRNEAWGAEKKKRKKPKKPVKPTGQGETEKNGQATGGLLMAMTPDGRWEVKIKYEEDCLAGTS